MKEKNYLILDDEFIQYCKLNNIVNVEKKAKEIFTIGFNKIKYGDKPSLIEELKIESVSNTITNPDSIKIKKKDDLYD